MSHARTFADVWAAFRPTLPADLPADEIAAIQAVFYLGAMEALTLQREIATTEMHGPTRVARLMALPHEVTTTTLALTTIHTARMRAQAIQ